jgi:hypothetical protein
MPEASVKRYRRDSEIVCRRVAAEVILVPIRKNVREVGIYPPERGVANRLDGTGRSRTRRGNAELTRRRRRRPART